MITYSQYVEWYANEKRNMLDSGVYASEPIFLFNAPFVEDSEFMNDYDYWTFNPDNWCGGDILRQHLYDTWWDDLAMDGVEIKRYFVDDEWHVFIFTKSSFYTLNWYKSRGCTDIIEKDGHPISLKEYIDICNKLGVNLTR